MLFTARGEFGTKTIEANNVLQAANVVAQIHGRGKSEWDFSLTDDATDERVEFAVEQDVRYGLLVFQVDDWNRHYLDRMGDKDFEAQAF